MWREKWDSLGDHVGTIVAMIYLSCTSSFALAGHVCLRWCRTSSSPGVFPSLSVPVGLVDILWIHEGLTGLSQGFAYSCTIALALFSSLSFHGS